MSDGEYKEIIAEMKGVKDILIDFRGYSRKKFDNIDTHLGKLNDKVASHEVGLVGKADNTAFEDVKIAVEKNKISKTSWIVFAGIFGLCTSLVTYIITRGG